MAGAFDIIGSPWRQRSVEGALGANGNLERVDVLVVDDDEADTELIMRVLRQHPEVAHAASRAAPDVALSDLANGVLQPDLILLDIQMPKMDGFAFVEALRTIAHRRHTPVVFLTTSRRKRDVDHALDTDAVSYMIKPDTLAELQERIDGVIRKFIAAPV